MLLPILPLKFITFSECEHLIVFLTDQKYSALEIIRYKKSASGKGTEVILTLKDNSQIIFTDSDKVYEKLKLSNISVYMCKLSFEKSIKSTVTVHLKCENEHTNILVDFESMFPISDFRSGIVDPKRHSKLGIPLMYTSKNTIGENCKVLINDLNVKIALADDETLKAYNLPAAYYSDDFYLSIIQIYDDKLSLSNISQNNNEYVYTSEKNSVIYNLQNKNRCIIKRRGYDDSYSEVIFYDNSNSELEITKLSILYDNISILDVVFSPTIKILTKKSNGNIRTGAMEVTIPHKKISFNCKYDIKSEVSKNLESVISMEYNISYYNNKWEESGRDLKGLINLNLDNFGEKIVSYNMEFKRLVTL